MIPGYDARREAQGRYPIIVVISGFTGNSEQNKDVVRRFAHAGFYAIAPELYSREGGMQGKDFAELGKIAAQVTRAQYLGDIKAAADFVVSHGPAFGNERWEEQSGYSPSTIAAEIAGLVAAGSIADTHHDPASARVYRATADESVGELHALRNAGAAAHVDFLADGHCRKCTARRRHRWKG